jgi:hypothetical protein
MSSFANYVSKTGDLHFQFCELILSIIFLYIIVDNSDYLMNIK